jgi:ATP-dependent DNA helicase DinG
MPTARELTERAFDRLAQTSGYAERETQRQLALILCDLIEERSTGAFEAPTGLGKSLAILIPAIANAIANDRRTMIATYTNVLAEQYWRQDLPLALSLFEDTSTVKSQFLIGRQRYACLAAMKQVEPELARRVSRKEILGIETDIREARKKSQFGTFWRSVSIPVACPKRQCPEFHKCFYYQARKHAQNAKIVITNHSVVLQDAMLGRSTDEEASLLGTYDFVVFDEAHDLAQAATSALEFSLCLQEIQIVQALGSSLLSALEPYAGKDFLVLDQATKLLRTELDQVAADLARTPASYTPILVASPTEIETNPGVAQRLDKKLRDSCEPIAERAAKAADLFLRAIEDVLVAWETDRPNMTRQIRDSFGSYASYIEGFRDDCRLLLHPIGVAVAHADGAGERAQIRQEIVSLAEPLRELIWSKTPWACLSATLALDGSFEYFMRTTGAEPNFSEILPSPFDFGTQAAVYIPKPDRIPDPAMARKNGQEGHYYQALANELTEIILGMEGRTLALFHSRKEMEGTAALMRLSPDYPVLLQPRLGATDVSRQFLTQTESSLFALRSFWTGFDAPGETCSCVVIVRVPFEIPVEPAQLARAAWMTSQGLDSFQSYSLPQAKMLVRQGVGRLIRRHEDRGVIVLLDPRLRSKRYGEEILANLPANVTVYDDIADAIGRLRSVVLT